MSDNKISVKDAIKAFDVVPKVDAFSFKGWHKIIGLYFFIIGLFNKSMKQAFYTNYWNVVGNTLYVPVHVDVDALREGITMNREPTVIHERCHLGQSAQDRWFMLKYIWINPKYRLAYELEAYEVSLRAWGKKFAHEGTVNGLIYDMLMKLADHYTKTLVDGPYKTLWRLSVDKDVFEHKLLVLVRGFANKAYDGALREKFLVERRHADNLFEYRTNDMLEITKYLYK